MILQEVCSLQYEAMLNSPWPLLPRKQPTTRETRTTTSVSESLMKGLISLHHALTWKLPSLGKSIYIHCCMQSSHMPLLPLLMNLSVLTFFFFFFLQIYLLTKTAVRAMLCIWNTFYPVLGLSMAFEFIPLAYILLPQAQRCYFHGWCNSSLGRICPIIARFQDFRSWIGRNYNANRQQESLFLSNVVSIISEVTLDSLKTWGQVGKITQWQQWNEKKW